MVVLLAHDLNIASPTARPGHCTRIRSADERTAAAVFHAGPSTQMNWFTTTGTGGSRRAGTRPGGDQVNGNAVMYHTGKILANGGGPAYEGQPATNAASIITITQDFTASARAVAPMNFARSFCVSVALPDGKVVVIGGMPFPVPFDDTNAVLPAGAYMQLARSAAEFVLVHLRDNLW